MTNSFSEGFAIFAQRKRASRADGGVQHFCCDPANNVNRAGLFRFALQQQLALQIEAALGHDFFTMAQT